MKFDIPWIRNNELILLQSDEYCITHKDLQLYGCVPTGFPSGRPNDTAIFSNDDALLVISYLKQLGVQTNYLLNGVLCNLPMESYSGYFNWIAKDLAPEYITVSDFILLKHLVDEYQFEQLEISTISGIDSLESFNAFVQDKKYLSKIKAIVLHHDVNRNNLHELRALTNHFTSRGIVPRVLVTESCYSGCGFRNKHYNFFSEVTSGRAALPDPYQINCIVKRLREPHSLLDLSGFLLPEHLDEFSKNTGINNFKISGRSKPDDWILNTSKHYFSGKSPENLYEIIVFTAPFLDELGMDVSDLFYVDSTEYYHIYNELINIEYKEAQSRYISQKAVELFQSGKLRINDPGSEYLIKDGSIVLSQKGEYHKLLEERTKRIANLQKLSGRPSLIIRS